MNWDYYSKPFYHRHSGFSVTTQSYSTPRISVSIPTTENAITQTPVHHISHPPPPHPVPSHHLPTVQTQAHPPSTHPPHHHHPVSLPVPPVHHPNHHVATPTSHANHSIPSGHHPHHHAVGPRLVCPPQPQQMPQQLQQQQQQQQQQFHTLAKKAHLIETQLNMDQNGAVKPDIHTPFRDKKDACIRLIRYHCLEQPVLSEKDLDKADEIFELTARHLIGKYAKMVDKYKYLLMKESMRQVRTSELMMLDRMFLNEEHESLLKLRQDYENEIPNGVATSTTANFEQTVPTSQTQPSTSHNVAAMSTTFTPQSGTSHCPDTSGDDYDEWACIQRELGCLPQNESASKHAQRPQTPHQQQLLQQQQQQQQQSKRSASSDSRLETLKRFRVDKHHKKLSDCANQGGGHSTGQSGKNVDANGSYSSPHDDNEPENNSIDEQVQSAIDSILNLQQNTALDLDSILS